MFLSGTFRLLFSLPFFFFLSISGTLGLGHGNPLPTFKCLIF